LTGRFFGQRRRLYETTQNFNSEPQNIEYRTAECRRMESLRSVIFYKIDRIPYFDIRYSLFDIRYSLFQSFTFDLTGRFMTGAAALKAEKYQITR